LYGIFHREKIRAPGSEVLLSWQIEVDALKKKKTISNHACAATNFPKIKSYSIFHPHFELKCTPASLTLMGYLHCDTVLVIFDIEYSIFKENYSNYRTECHNNALCQKRVVENYPCGKFDPMGGIPLGGGGHLRLV